MAKDPQTVAQLYRQGVAQGGTKYQAGVGAAAQDWETQARSEAAETAYAAGVARAAQQKIRQKALQSVSGSDWAKAASTTGASNYTGAATRAAEKFEKQIPDILSAGEAAKQASRAIDGSTMESRLRRSVEAAKAVHRHWARKKGIQPEV
jgi:hypothetical protein